MDSITQATLGAAVGHLCWHNQIGRKAIFIGAAIGTIPDLDIVVYPFLDKVQQLYWHRGESHSVFFMLLGAIPTAWLLSRLFKEKELNFTLSCLGAFLIYSTHILIDVFTIYGTQLLAPISRKGFAFGNFFIIDPLFTLPLLIGLALAYLLKPPWSIRMNALGLVAVSCYAIWSLSMQTIAKDKFHVAMDKSGYEIKRQLTSAGAFTTFLWRNVAETSDGFLLGYWSLFDNPNQDIEFHYIPKQAETIAAIRDTRKFRVVEWFSKGWWCVMASDEDTARVVDLRFTEIPSTRNQHHQLWNWPFAWKFDLDKKDQQPLQAVIPKVDNPFHTLYLLAHRIKGGKGWLNDSGEVKVSMVSDEIKKR